MNLQPPNSTITTAADWDSAPWLTLVHGATHNRHYFDAQVSVLQQDFRLLLIDLPGHGDSESLPGPYGFEEYAAAVLAAMDAADVEATHYIGTHTGSVAALILATRHPERFLSMVLEGPPIPGEDLPSIVEAVDRARSVATSSGVDAARLDWFEGGGWFDNMRANPERCRATEHWELLMQFSGKPWLDTSPAQPVAPVRDRLSSIQCPVLIINGEHDVPDFTAAGEDLERLLPNVRRIRVAGTGGFPMWEDPDAVNELIRRHLPVKS